MTMGTRHLIAAMVDGQYRLAQYGQWDGNPGGQGLGVLRFLRDMKPSFVEKLRGCRYATDEQIKETWNGYKISPEGMVAYDEAKDHDRKYPSLSRDTGSDILALIQTAETMPLLRDSIDFAGDSLFCEWAYVVDFDKRTFEVYRGFNNSSVPDGERFANAPMEDSPRRDVKYYPVKLAKSYSLDALPGDKEFVAELSREDD
jgi:hypothetical protein